MQHCSASAVGTLERCFLLGVFVHSMMCELNRGLHENSCFDWVKKQCVNIS